MRLATLLSDVWRGLTTRPATVLYPAERRAPPPQLRGLLTSDLRQCTGCQLCVKDCPANALELVTLDRAAKRFVMRYQADRCVYCGQCVASCRFKCLTLAPEQWELAALTKDNFQHNYGAPADVAVVLDRDADAHP